MLDGPPTRPPTVQHYPGPHDLPRHSPSTPDRPTITSFSECLSRRRLGCLCCRRCHNRTPAQTKTRDKSVFAPRLFEAMFHCRKVDSAAGRVELLDLSGVIEYDPFTPAKPSYTGSTFALIHWPGLKTIMQVSLPFAARLRSNNDPSRTSISSTSVTIATEFFGRKTCTVPSSEDS